MTSAVGSQRTTAKTVTATACSHYNMVCWKVNHVVVDDRVGVMSERQARRHYGSLYRGREESETSQIPLILFMQFKHS